MSTEFLYNYTEAEVPAGMIARHPEVQRKVSVRQFFDKCGMYDEALNLSPALLVEADDAAREEGIRYYAVDAATRIEACAHTPGYGPETPIRARIYANGRLPTDRELAELFLAANVQRTNVSAAPAFRISLLAEREAAIVADGLAKKLGPESKAGSGLMKLVDKRGEEAVTAAVEEAYAIWPEERNIIMAVVKAVLQILDEGGVDRLRQRRSKLRKEGIDNLYKRARLAHYGQNGKRPSVGQCLVKVILGVRTR